MQLVNYWLLQSQACQVEGNTTNVMIITIFICIYISTYIIHGSTLPVTISSYALVSPNCRTVVFICFAREAAASGAWPVV